MALCASPKLLEVCLQQAKQLADDLRERVKALGYDRYKLVVQASASSSFTHRIEYLLFCPVIFAI